MRLHPGGVSAYTSPGGKRGKAHTLAARWTDAMTSGAGGSCSSLLLEDEELDDDDPAEEDANTGETGAGSGDGGSLPPGGTGEVGEGDRPRGLAGGEGSGLGGVPGSLSAGYSTSLSSSSLKAPPASPPPTEELDLLGGQHLQG